MTSQAPWNFFLLAAFFKLAAATPVSIVEIVVGVQRAE
jgi:hypothetical protein